MKKLLIGILSATLTISVYAADNFLKGENFDGETGLKTGAQLEDLITEATLIANDAGTNRIYDNVTIDVNSDANVKLQVKTDGINATHITNGAVTTAEILDGTILAADLAAGVITAPTNLNGFTSMATNAYPISRIYLTTNALVHFGDTIPFDVADDNIGNSAGYDIPNHRFSPNSTGIYYVSAFVNMDGDTSPGANGYSAWSACIYYNGTGDSYRIAIGTSQHGQVARDHSSYVSAYALLGGTNYAYIGYSGDSASTKWIEGSASGASWANCLGIMPRNL